MNQWILPEIKPVSDTEAVDDLLDTNDRMGKALAYAYRAHPWLKAEVLRHLSDEGVEPPDIAETVFITYRRADGEACFGEFTFMVDYSGLDEEDSDIIEERWVLEGKRTIPHPHDESDDEFEHLYEEDEEGVRKFKEQ